MTEWQPMETAPKGVWSEFTTDPAYVAPPNILLLFPDTDNSEMSVGYWDWCYDKDGRQYDPAHLAWIEPVSGEQLTKHYGVPTGWMPLPETTETSQ